MQSRNDIQFSIIIPVYNRPDEIKELLASLERQTYRDFEVIVVEDGSSVLCEKISRGFMGRLNLKYFYKENSGPGLSRNYGMQRAEGNYFIIFDSDVIVPENYMQIVFDELSVAYVDAYGGPDAAAENFTSLQKAISFAMTSLLTTGGIRGKGDRLEKFHPRSFNMGISKKVFIKTGGFSAMRYGEDIDLSIRIMKAGFTTALFKNAFVYHKRRNDYVSFFKQVYHSGEARVILSQKHRGSLKILHFFPVLFFTGLLVGIFVAVFFHLYFLFGLYILYFFLIFLSATLKYKDFKTGLQAVWSSIVMLSGYGLGFISAFLKSKFTLKS
jgi:glycosyltransferase involved in cell wall biosynthesis